MVHDYVLQPLLTTDTHKQCKIPHAKSCYGVEDIRLKCFEQIADWLQDDCHSSFFEEQKNCERFRFIILQHTCEHES